MTTLSAGLIKATTLNVVGSSSGAIQATNVDTTTLNANKVNATNFNLDNDLQVLGNLGVDGNFTVDGNFINPGVNNQLTAIQYAVGSDPNASISDQDALKEMNFLQRLMSNFNSALTKYNNDPTDTTVIPIFTGSFEYTNPTDGSGYIGELWKYDYNPLVQFYMGPSGEETRAINSLSYQIFTYSIIAIAFLVKYNCDGQFVNTQTPFYRKLMEEYDNPSLCVNFRVSMYNMCNYSMRQLRNALDPTDTEQAVYISLIIAVQVLFENEIVILNSNLQMSGNPANYPDYYNGNITFFDGFTNTWGFGGGGDQFNLPFPFLDNVYTFGASYTPDSPEWTGAVANNSVKYFKAFGRMLNYWANAFKTEQPIFHKYANGATGSTTLGYTNDLNTFEYYNPTSETTTTQVKYYVQCEGGVNLVQSLFTTLDTPNINSDRPFTGDTYPNLYIPINGIFTLPANWWDFQRNDFFTYIQGMIEMRDYLLTLEGGQAVIDAVQVVWENEVLPASADCYAQFKLCKINNLIDDSYTGPWRRFLTKDIDYLDVINVPYTIYFQDGTSLPLNDEGIRQAIGIENAILAQMINVQPTGDVPVFTKQDSSMNYTNYPSFQSVSDNYAIENSPISLVTPEILSGTDTDSKTCASGIFESGVQLAKYFDDLESLAIYTGLGNGGIVLYTELGNLLTQSDFNHVKDGVFWDIQNVYDRFLTTIGKTKSDWEVLGYYYGRYPTSPLYNVFNPDIFNGPGNTDSSGNTLAQRRALQGGANQYILEGGSGGPGSPTGWDDITTRFQLVYDGSGATPYRSTRVNVASLAAPLTDYVVRANYDPSGIPVCLDFDYCLIEHYKIDEVTGYPLVVDNLYQIVSGTDFINGTGGNIGKTSTKPIIRDAWRCRSLLNQIHNLVFLCWYNFAINQGGAATYQDASGIDVPGNGIYSPAMCDYIKNNYFFAIQDAYNPSSSTLAGELPLEFANTNAWYSDTFGCLGDGYTGPASIPGRVSFGVNANGTIDPQKSVRPQYDMTPSTHEIFGHGVQGGYPRTQFTADPVPWPISVNQFNAYSVYAIRDGYIPDEYQGGYYAAQYNNGVIAEGYATIMEIMCVKYGLYRSVELAQIGYSYTLNYFAILYALLNLARIVARLMVVGGNGDPTSGAGKGDVSSYPWITRTFTEIQKILNMDSTQRIVAVPNQMVTYAFGLINNLNVINQILTESFPTDPELFKQYNFDYWRMTEATVLTGDSLLVAGLAKPRSFWVDEIVIPS